MDEEEGKGAAGWEGVVGGAGVAGREDVGACMGGWAWCEGVVGDDGRVGGCLALAFGA